MADAGAGESARVLESKLALNYVFDARCGLDLHLASLCVCVRSRPALTVFYDYHPFGLWGVKLAVCWQASSAFRPQRVRSRERCDV